MAIAPYDPAAGGPSSGAQMAELTYQDNLSNSSNRTDMQTQQQRNKQQFLGLDASGNQTGFGSAAMLQSSLGASGQAYGSAGQYAEGQAQTEFQNRQADLRTGFDRAHMQLKRNEALASIGLIL